MHYVDLFFFSYIENIKILYYQWKFVNAFANKELLYLIIEFLTSNKILKFPEASTLTYNIIGRIFRYDTKLMIDLSLNPMVLQIMG